MYNGNWSRGVKFDLGSRRRIGTTMEAAHFLLYRWPTKGGKAYKVAREICMDALEGKASPEQAKAAFMRAAQEADLPFTEQETAWTAAKR